MATITNTICTSGIQSVHQAGTGAVNISTAASANTTTIGNVTGATAVNINTGTGGTALTTTNGQFLLHTGTGSIKIGSDSTDKLILIGSSSIATNTMSIATGSAALNITTIAGNLSLGNNTTGTVSLGGTSVTAIDITAGTGTVNISVDANATTVNVATGIGAKTLVLGSTNTTSTTTINCGSGGLNIPSFTTAGALVSTSAGLITDANASTSGYVLTSNGSGSAPSFQAASGGSGFTWNSTTGSTQAMAVSNGYVSNDGATLVTFTLPATATIGQQTAVQGYGSGLWTIAQNAGQTIHFNAVNSTTGTGGTVSSTSQYDSITLTCAVANTDWVVYQVTGNVSIV